MRMAMGPIQGVSADLILVVVYLLLTKVRASAYTTFPKADSHPCDCGTSCDIDKAVSCRFHS